MDYLYLDFYILKKSFSGSLLEGGSDTLESYGGGTSCSADNFYKLLNGELDWSSPAFENGFAEVVSNGYSSPNNEDIMHEGVGYS